MKKLLLLCLVLLGGVMQVSATKRIWVDLSSSNNNWTAANAITAIHYAGKDMSDYTPMTIVYMYGKKWCYYDVDDNVTPVVLKRYNPNNTSQYWNQTQNITWSDSNDKYIKIDNPRQGVFTGINIDAPSWNYIVMRNNYISGESGDWTNYQHNTYKDGDVFSYELTKAQIDSKSYLKDQGLRFRFHHGDKVKYDDCGTDKGDNKYPEIAPKVAGGVAAPFDTDITDYYQDVNSGNYWQVTLPDYDYEKLVFVADYSTHSWKIRVDAYITKEVSGTNEYATLGCSVPLEIIESNGVTAHPLTANASTGKITKGDAISVIPSNEGALLENATGSNKTIRAKVLASASASASNDLVAFLDYGNKLAKVTETGKTNYILTIKNSKVGFYMVNSKGNAMGANTAYLKVVDSSSGSGARSAYFFDNETTGIANLNVNDNANFNADAPMYNLAGQRVGKNYKGVVIVNGKKMLNK